MLYANSATACDEVSARVMERGHDHNLLGGYCRCVQAGKMISCQCADSSFLDTPNVDAS